MANLAPMTLSRNAVRVSATSSAYRVLPEIQSPVSVAREVPGVPAVMHHLHGKHTGCNYKP